MIAGQHKCFPFVAMNRMSIVVAQCMYHHSVAQQLTWLTSSLRLVAKASVAVSLVTCRTQCQLFLFQQLYLPMLEYLMGASRRSAAALLGGPYLRCFKHEQPQGSSACSNSQRCPRAGMYAVCMKAVSPNACKHFAQCMTHSLWTSLPESLWYMKSYHELILHVSSPIAAWQHGKGGNSCLLLLLLLNQGFTQGKGRWADPCLHHHKGTIIPTLPHQQYHGTSTWVMLGHH